MGFLWGSGTVSRRCGVSVGSPRPLAGSADRRGVPRYRGFRTPMTTFLVTQRHRCHLPACDNSAPNDADYLLVQQRPRWSCGRAQIIHSVSDKAAESAATGPTRTDTDREAIYQRQLQIATSRVFPRNAGSPVQVAWRAMRPGSGRPPAGMLAGVGETGELRGYQRSGWAYQRSAVRWNNMARSSSEKIVS